MVGDCGSSRTSSSHTVLLLYDRILVAVDRYSGICLKGVFSKDGTLNRIID